MRGYLGNQTRSRPKQSAKSKSSGGQGGRRRRRKPQSDEYPDDDGNLEVISPDQLEISKNAMNLTDLKDKPASDLVELGETDGPGKPGRSRKQDIIFSILKAQRKAGENIYGDGVLEILQDGFGFLRSADGSYLAGPDDIYVRPARFAFQSAHRRHRFGPDRPPKDGERYFASAEGRRDQLRCAGKCAQQGVVRKPDAAASARPPGAGAGQRQHRRPDRRIIDMVAPIGKGQRG